MDLTNGATGFGDNERLDRYRAHLDSFIEQEYPTLKGTTYLDHAGTTPYARSLITNCMEDFTKHLFGNPHSASASSQLTARRIDDVRLKTLQFFGASAEDFDVVFVQNATAAIRLVAECLRDRPHGFAFRYHQDSHTSLVGCRELASQGSVCFETDEAVDAWIASLQSSQSCSPSTQLFAYPGQSNMTGRRLPTRWCRELREASAHGKSRLLTLLDAASLASTAPIDLTRPQTSPDFMAVSFYKIFGFPDLGALLVSKNAVDALTSRRYFAGGTVDGVTIGSTGEQWFARKKSIHAAFEEGTLPFHNIIALDHAFDTHRKLFGSMQDVSRHVFDLTRAAEKQLRSLQHLNGTKLVNLYRTGPQDKYGPIIAFNLRDDRGRHHSAAEVDKLCNIKGIQLRTGGLCNPGGIAKYLNLSSELVKAQYAAGKRCGDGDDMVEGRPTSAIRISFGAMSTLEDVDCLVRFLKEFFVSTLTLNPSDTSGLQSSPSPRFFIDELAIFPIKSCAAFSIPRQQSWSVTKAGLAWDREWCLVHAGTHTALSQKKYPQMALIEPTLDLSSRTLTVTSRTDVALRTLEIDLDAENTEPTQTAPNCTGNGFRQQRANVCNDSIVLQVYTAGKINSFFSDILGVPCALARCATKHSGRNVKIRVPKGQAQLLSERTNAEMRLANESPLLVVSLSSVDELNKQIRENAQKTGQPFKPVTVHSFRGNIIVTESGSRSPYHEDSWKSVKVEQAKGPDTNQSPERFPMSVDEASTSATDDSSSNRSGCDVSTTIASDRSVSAGLGQTVELDILGPCQRCQMVSVDQSTGMSHYEPFATLAKTRRKGDGRVWFGVHASVQCEEGDTSRQGFLRAGDVVNVRCDH